MVTYLIRRISLSIIFMLLAGLLIYTGLIIYMPDGPGYDYFRIKEAMQQASQGADQAAPGTAVQVPPDPHLEEYELIYKLDHPWPLNFFRWLFDPDDTSTVVYDLQGNPSTIQKGINVSIAGLSLRGSGFLTGDFGRSLRFARLTPISEIFAIRWANTFILVSTALAGTLLVGIPVGVIGAMRQRSTVDNVFTFLTLSSLSTPPFMLGLLLIMFLAVMPSILHEHHGWTWLPWLPAGSAGTDQLSSRALHVLLPAATLAIPQIAWISRYTRFALLDVLNQDYIRTAWAKGLAARRVVFKHAMRNALIPLITHVALSVPTLVSGTIAIETVFAYEGMGKAFYRAIGGCLATVSTLAQDPPPCPWSGYVPIDHPLALVLLMIMVIIVSAANVVADILYAVADPRVNYGATNRNV
jgi:peptide/nickel transport system permease protein